MTGDLDVLADRLALVAFVGGPGPGQFAVLEDPALAPTAYRVAPPGTVYLGPGAYAWICARAAADGIDVAERERLWRERN
jgi:hypothetical protein